MASKIERLTTRCPALIGIAVVLGSYAIGAGILLLAYRLAQ